MNELTSFTANDDGDITILTIIFYCPYRQLYFLVISAHGQHKTSQYQDSQTIFYILSAKENRGQHQYQEQSFWRRKNT